MSARRIRIDPHALESREFEGFGTSLAWWANAVGRLPEAEREPFLRRLFSLADGGLGLSVVRFNAGGGEQPGRPVTMEPRAVMEGYRSAPGARLDESADPGQRAVLRDAVRIAAEEGRELVVEVFGNSPPWWATRSGSVTGATDRLGWSAPNLAPRFAEEYLHYLADVADFVERDCGARVESISPFNEPTSQWWRYGGRQEGCRFTRRGIDGLLRDVAAMETRPGAADSAALAYASRLVVASEDWSLHQSIRAWDRLSPLARAVVGRFNTHTYHGTRRAALRARIAREGIPLWVSEFGVGDSTGALLAETVVRDLRELAPTAWVLWQAVSPDDWGLMVSDATGRPQHDTSALEVFARFTRALRPGMRFAGCDDPCAVAAVGDDGRVAVVVRSTGPASEDARAGGLDATTEAVGAAASEALEVDFGGFALASGGGVLRVVVETSIAGRPGSPASEEIAADADGVVRFELPAGSVASVVALGRCEVRANRRGFLGSGGWWLESEGGARLGLLASGEGELAAGVRVAGVAPDDCSLAQRWRAEACGDGDARWVCEASGMQLDVALGSRRSGARVIQWHSHAAEDTPSHDRWRVEAAEGGRVWLRVRHSRLALALDEHGRALQRPAGKPGTSWRLVRAGEASGHGDS